jgi:chemotaxis protein CheZ
MNSPVKSFRIERFGQQMEPGRAMPAALNHLPLRASEREAIAAALQAGNGLRRAAIELAAVVADTCRAANAILAGAEEIDSAVERLRMTDTWTGRSSEALDAINEGTVGIFQACDFQDLTGQRIENVVGLLAKLETRLGALRAASGEPQRLAEDFGEGVNQLRKQNASELENGPRLQSDDGHLTQSQVDLLLGMPAMTRA